MDLTLRTTPTFLEGVYMLANAIEDCVAVITLGPCVYEQIAQTFMAHDYFQTLLQPDQRHRIAVTFADQTTGTLGHEKALEDLIRKVASDLPSTSLVIVPEIVRLAMTGEDLTALCARLASELRISIVYIKTPGLVRDWQDAIGGLMEHLLTRLPEPTGHSQIPSVCLLGYPYERREGDHTGNVAELQSMLGAIGIEVPVVWPCGRPSAPAPPLRRPAAAVLFPPVHGWKDRFREKGFSPVLETCLPVGLRGSAEWIGEVARCTDREAQARGYCKLQMNHLAPMLSKLANSHLAGRGAMVIADESWLDPVCRFFQDELGIRVIRSILRRRGTGAGSGHPQTETGVPSDPSVQSLREELGRALLDQDVDLMVGNAWEHNVIRQTHPHIPWFEFGYPCFERHHFAPRPFLGFGGALVWAEELVNLLLRSSSAQAPSVRGPWQEDKTAA